MKNYTICRIKLNQRTYSSVFKSCFLRARILIFASCLCFCHWHLTVSYHSTVSGFLPPVWLTLSHCVLLPLQCRLRHTTCACCVQKQMTCLSDAHVSLPLTTGAYSQSPVVSWTLLKSFLYSDTHSCRNTMHLNTLLSQSDTCLDEKDWRIIIPFFWDFSTCMSGFQRTSFVDRDHYATHGGP